MDINNNGSRFFCSFLGLIMTVTTSVFCDLSFSEKTTFVKLHGGLNGSEVIKISDPNQGEFVLRKNAPQLNKSFILELEIFKIFSNHDLAPIIFHANPSEGVILMEFIEDDIESKINKHKQFIQALGDSLRKLHQIPVEEVFKNTSVNPSKNILDSILELVEEIQKQGYFCLFQDESEQNQYFDKMRHISEMFNENSDIVLTHRDTNFGNVLYEKTGRIKFIDFEVSGVDTKYVDLATVDNFYLHSDEDRKDFLESYFQRAPTENEFKKFQNIVPFTHLYHAAQLALVVKDKVGLSKDEIDALLPLYEMEKLISQGKIKLNEDNKNVIRLIYALVIEVKRLLK